MSCCPRPDADDFDPDCEGPSAADVARFSRETMTCPECHAELFDDSTVCPECGHALTRDEQAGGATGTKVWIAVTAIVAIALILFVYVL